MSDVIGYHAVLKLNTQYGYLIHNMHNYYMLMFSFKKMIKHLKLFSNSN